MNPCMSTPTKYSYYKRFPKNRDFFLLDKDDYIKYRTPTKMNDPDYIFIISEDFNKKIHENIYRKRDFMGCYYFVKVKENNSNVYLNFIIPKNKFSFGNRSDRLLTEIKIKPSYMDEIFRRTNIDFRTQNQITFKESLSIPDEEKFYDNVFTLYIKNQTFPQLSYNQGGNYNTNINNINYNNINTANYNNNYGQNYNNNGYSTLNNAGNKNHNNMNTANYNNNYVQNYNNNGYSTLNNPDNYIIGNNLNNWGNLTPYKNQINIDNNVDNPNYNNRSTLRNSCLPLTSKLSINNISNNTSNTIPQNSVNNNNYLNNRLVPPQTNINYKYIFPKKGLRNIGSTCYMNATLQCLLHVCELIVYFLEEYPKDKTTLNSINKKVKSGGDISKVFYNLVKGVCDEENKTEGKNNLKPKTFIRNSGYSIFGNYNIYGYDNSSNTAFSPDEFKRTLGSHNSQFKKFEANDSKDLILYLLQTMHDELNYFGDKNQRLNYYPNQYNMTMAYNYFTTVYNTNNFSKISVLFYGTYKNSTICNQCKNILFNFQKFEFISFGMYYYNRKEFNLLDGFKDNAKINLLKGDNKFLCNICNKLQEAETTCKIYEPPNKLLINIDYGKNKMFQPSRINFEEVIDITEFVDFDYRQRIKYRILGVCTHYGSSGQFGHYVAFCRNIKENKWYEFNDSSCGECGKNSIYGGSPYLLLYERTFE